MDDTYLVVLDGKHHKALWVLLQYRLILLRLLQSRGRSRRNDWWFPIIRDSHDLPSHFHGRGCSIVGGLDDVGGALFVLCSGGGREYRLLERRLHLEALNGRGNLLLISYVYVTRFVRTECFHTDFDGVMMAAMSADYVCRCR